MSQRADEVLGVETVLVTPMVQVVFGEDRQDPAPFPLADALRGEEDAATISDDMLIARVELYLDLESGTLRDMKVTRPAVGNILIAAPFEFG
jgi:hypothetical protein